MVTSEILFYQVAQKNLQVNKSVQLANRLREVILNGTWIANTNFKDQLEALDWELAVRKHGDLNSIALLAQHIHYYIHGVKNVLEGGSLEIRDKYSFDFPPITSDTMWQAFLTRFWSDTEAFAQLVEKLPEDQLRQAFVKQEYGDYQRNIDGLIEHSYYHLGQIVLQLKMK